PDPDDHREAFMDKFKTQKYENAFNESNWEEEFDKVPMFMKRAPEEIDPVTHPDLACLQSIIHNDDSPPEEQAKRLKNEGNDYFKEKNYKKAILSYTEGLKKNCVDSELNAVLYTNRAAAHFHLGNIRSALNDATAAKRLKPDHLKALLRGGQCCMVLRSYTDALRWCDEGLQVHPTDKSLQELRCKADKLKRAVDRDARKAKLKEKKERGERDALLAAIKDDMVDAGRAEMGLDGVLSQEATGARVYLDEQGALNWPVLFLYPEHRQTDFISAFNESSRFMDHLAVMFGQELPPWDTDQKYQPQNLQLYFEDEETEEMHQVDLQTPLLKALQHIRCSVKAGTPSFIVLVAGSPFCKQFLSGKKVHHLKYS
uniref:Cns1/TTC4 wheel domain-containing protein n=1 Tax=Denticeps clupeoides TaxID=299321 RepID=A0AAY4EI43_9TELE